MLYRRLPIVSVFLALALVFSLVGGSLTFPRASMAANLGAFFVTPTPEEGQFLPVCQEFTIRVQVGAGAQPETGVSASIMLLQEPKLVLEAQDGQGGAELVSGDVRQTIANIPAGGSWYPQWTWHCTGVGPVEFQVSVASDNIGPIEINRYFFQGKPHLVANITAPLDNVVYTPCTNFTVTTTLTNTGDIVAEEVTALLEIDGPASFVCDAETNDVTQGDHLILATRTDGFDSLVCDTRAVGIECEDQDGQFPAGNDDYVYLQYLCIPQDETYQVSWTLHCDGPGDVVLTVRPNGWMHTPPENPPERGGDFTTPIYEDNLEQGRITVHQVDRNNLLMGVPPPSSPCADIPGCPVCFTPPINIVPRELRAGQPVTIAVSALNNCDTVGKFLVPLTVNGRVEQTQTVEISPHGAYPVKFTVVKNEPGTYTVNFDNYKSSFVVQGSVDGGSVTSRNLVIPVIIFSLLAIIAVALVMMVRRRPA